MSQASSAVRFVVCLWEESFFVDRRAISALEWVRYGPEEVVHARNVIAFFVWAWPSGFCD